MLTEIMNIAEPSTQDSSCCECFGMCSCDCK